MAQVATKLFETRTQPCRLSPLIFMTDPSRVPDVVAAAQNLPYGAAIIYRHFGSAHRFIDAENLRQITFKRGQQLLIGADPELAIEVGADGVHFRRDAKVEAPALWRRRCPDWLISMAGIKSGEYQDNLSLLDALIVSSVFPSESPSAGEPIGVAGLRKAVQNIGAPVFALGGVTANTAHELTQTGAAGLAGISGFIPHKTIGNKMTDVNITAETTDYGFRITGRVPGNSEIAELTLKKVRADVYNANHTGVPKSMGGKGVGKALVKFLSTHARENGYTVIPGCPFVGVMWKRYPEWAEGVAH